MKSYRVVRRRIIVQSQDVELPKVKNRDFSEVLTKADLRGWDHVPVLTTKDELYVQETGE